MRLLCTCRVCFAVGVGVLDITEQECNRLKKLNFNLVWVSCAFHPDVLYIFVYK